jgi:hypothetical protein
MVLIESNAKLEVSVWQDLIDVINETEKEVEAANQWLPFDPDNIPEAKEGWCLLITKKGDWGNCYNTSGDEANSWISDDCISLKPQYYKGFSYKLVPLT